MLISCTENTRHLAPLSGARALLRRTFPVTFLELERARGHFHVLLVAARFGAAQWLESSTERLIQRCGASLVQMEPR